MISVWLAVVFDRIQNPAWWGRVDCNDDIHDNGDAGANQDAIYVIQPAKIIVRTILIWCCASTWYILLNGLLSWEWCTVSVRLWENGGYPCAMVLVQLVGQQWSRICKLFKHPVLFVCLYCGILFRPSLTHHYFHVLCACVCYTHDKNVWHFTSHFCTCQKIWCILMIQRSIMAVQDIEAVVQIARMIGSNSWKAWKCQQNI